MSSDKIPSYQTLYKHKKSGKITEWTLQIVPASPTCYDLIVKFGEQNGAIQTHITHITKGKMKRNLLEQSVLEANRKWNDKKREGFVETLYDHQPFIFRPMLANTFQFNLYSNSPLSRAYKIPFPAYIQKKYDGIRCVCKWDECKESLRFETRNGIEIKILSFHESLNSDLRKLFFSSENSQKRILDGELFTNDCTFQILNGTIRTGFNQPNFQISADDLNKIKLVQYHVYDLYDPSDPTMIYENRKQKLKSFFEKNVYSQLKLVETEIASTIDDIKQKHDVYI
jgi:ATP-dependent DNA ligase